MGNQTPEQSAREPIDAQLQSAGWVVQNKTEIDFNVGEGQAVRDYQTGCGPADDVLFVDGKPVGVIEAKKESLGQNITTAEDQTGRYAAAKLKWVQDSGGPLPFFDEATGSGKVFTAITSIDRPLKHAKVRRVLFLVDTRNAGEQAGQEFIAYTPTDEPASHLLARIRAEREAAAVKKPKKKVSRKCPSRHG